MQTTHPILLLNRPYAAEANERQTFDLAIPAGASGSAGLVLCIHGGGWVEGSKDPYAEDLRRMSAERGVAAAAVNYRYLSETVGFDGILDDITAALAAIRAEGINRGVVFDRALLTGVSAGGHLSLLYAYTKRDTAPIKPVCVAELCGPADLEDRFYYFEGEGAAQGITSWICNIIGLGVGQTVSPDTLDAARGALRRYSPINYVDEKSVPTVFGHGERDDIVPLRNAIDLDRKLAACGVEHTFVSFPNSGHGCEDKNSMHKFMELFFACAERYLK
ncbi:MAG: alpha/beta hydrolase [Clostridia bacterium]|nr:alpha/beta hydrolase [Clostridia bacterium]